MFLLVFGCILVRKIQLFQFKSLLVALLNQLTHFRRYAAIFFHHSLNGSADRAKHQADLNLLACLRSQSYAHILTKYFLSQEIHSYLCRILKFQLAVVLVRLAGLVTNSGTYVYPLLLLVIEFDDKRCLFTF